MLKPGSPAPDFALPDSQGVLHSLRVLLSSGLVVLMFYPADNTPICTKQGCMVRDRFAEIRAAGVQVVGISPQGAEVKAAFASSNRLPHLLLVDKGSRVAALYGARGLFGLPLPLGTRRMSFLVEHDASVGPRIGQVAHQEFGLTAHENLLDNALRLARQRESGKEASAASPGAKGHA